MAAPDFWGPRSSAAGSIAAGLLTPVGALVSLAARVRQATARPWRARVPVICVGNLTVGGAGKTPTALALAKRLAEKGIEPHFLIRGYGGAAVGPLRVEREHHDARAVGDEALLLGAQGPTWVGADRVAGARAAIDAGARLLIMDDGFQNPALAKDLSLLVVDGGFGFGNGRVMPAGPLRESLGAGLARADALVMIGADSTGAGAKAAGRLPVIDAVIGFEGTASGLAGRRVTAFAGIGRPAKFFESLEAAGCKIVARHGFADHHSYSAGELDRLASQAARDDAVLVTTEKDAVRLPPEWRERVGVLRIALEWRDPARLDALIEPLLARAAAA